MLAAIYPVEVGERPPGGLPADFGARMIALFLTIRKKEENHG